MLLNAASALVVVVWSGGHRNDAGDDGGGDPYGGDVEDGESVHGVRRGYARSVQGSKGNVRARLPCQTRVLDSGCVTHGGGGALLQWRLGLRREECEAGSWRWWPHSP